MAGKGGGGVGGGSLEGQRGIRGKVPTGGEQEEEEEAAEAEERWNETGPQNV